VKNSLSGDPVQFRPIAKNSSQTTLLKEEKEIQARGQKKPEQFKNHRRLVSETSEKSTSLEPKKALGEME